MYVLIAQHHKVRKYFQNTDRTHRVLKRKCRKNSGNERRQIYSGSLPMEGVGGLNGRKVLRIGSIFLQKVLRVSNTFPIFEP